MSAKRHTSTVGEVIKIPIDDQRVAVAYTACVRRESYKIFVLGFAQLFDKETSNEELVNQAQVLLPTFALDTGTELIDLHDWEVIGRTERADTHLYFPVYKKREAQGWVLEDLTTQYVRDASPQESRTLNFRSSFSASTLQDALKGESGVIGYPAWADRVRVGKYPLARDYFDNYDPPLAQ